MKVRELMTTRAASVCSDDSLGTAAQAMWDCDCGSVPVKDGNTGQVIGMITDRDICMATWSKDRAPSAIRVSEAVSGQLFSCKPDDSVAAAEQLMCRKQIRRIPVLDQDRKLLGILSLADIATRAKSSGAQASGSDELAPSKVAETLTDICRPHSNHQPAAPAE